MKKTILITGGSSGIGKAIATLFREKDYEVVTIGKTHGKEIDNNNHFVVDVSDYYAVKKVIDSIDTIDIVVNCAGVINSDEEPESFSIETLNSVIDVNLKGTIMICGLVIDKMVSNNVNGNVINISSISNKGSKYFPIYSASKGAIVSYTKSIASRYGKEGIRCNVISPGIIETPMSYHETADFKDYIPGLIEKHCLNRIGRPSDIAKLVSFLVSDDAEFIIGEEIVIDGGYTLGKE